MVLDNVSVESCLLKLNNQIHFGLKSVELATSYVPVFKNDIVYFLKDLKDRLENRYNCTFSLNRTVDGVNTDLACKKLGMYFVIRVNMCKSSAISRYKNWYKNYSNLKIFFLSSLKDCINEEKGFFYIPESVLEDDYESFLENIYINFINFYDGVDK